MKRFVEGEDRSQVTLLPECLDDFVGEDNPVRVIDVFIDELDLTGLGFDRVAPADTGRPAYHPAVLLKIYVYGYLNRLQSSRRLERETQRNVELMWLTGRLTPDFKTIADFRKDNGKAIRNVCREFIVLCRRLDLFSEAIVAIDGSKFKAVNNRDKNFTDHKLKKRMDQLEESIGRYLAELDRADRDPTLVTEGRVSRLKEKVATVKAHMEQLKQIGQQLQAAPDGQVSLTDPDARSMATSGRGTGIVGYNVQTAVDTKHHLIVAHEVTNVGHDRTQLASMAKQARSATGKEDLTVVADRGYFNSPEILECDQAGMAPLVPKPLTSNSKADGRFDKRDFVYIAEDDEYRCPAGQRAIKRFTTIENGLTQHKYWSSACPRCALRAQCTTSVYRRIARWEHEAVLEAMQDRLDRQPDAMQLRRQTVEHPFGTLKAWMGATHFLTKRLPRVSTEMSLHVLAYTERQLGLYDDAQKAFDRAAAINPNSAYFVEKRAYFLEQRGMLAEAIADLRRAAALEGSWAYEKLIFAYTRGALGLQKDLAIARSLCEESAAMRIAAGESCLGYFYREGLAGLAKNPQEAAKWDRLSAHHGNPAAANDIGWRLLRGDGIPEDRAEAIFWLRKSARAGHEPAITKLRNLGVPIEEPERRSPELIKGDNRSFQDRLS